MAKYRHVAGFWLTLAALAWTFMALGVGLDAIASNPTKYVNDVMIPALVLLVALAALFIWLALRFRRKGRRFTETSR